MDTDNNTLAKHISLFVIILLASSCAMKGTESKIFKTYYNDEYRTKSERHKINVPKGYYNVNIVKGQHEKESRYLYPDSSIFYFSNERRISELNFENLEADTVQYQMYLDAMKTGDFVSVQGQNKNNLFWKCMIYKRISIGYCNVNNQSKRLYDKCLQVAR